jgi:hypothetical protein
MNKLLLLSFFLCPVLFAGAQNMVKIKECVIINGNLTELEVDYDKSTGERTILVNGVRKRFYEVYPSTGKDYAATTTWYLMNEEINFNDRPYVKYGLPRVLGVNEISKVGIFKGVNVYVETGVEGRPGVIYIPVRSGCEFQPYQISPPECGNLEVTPSVKEIKIGGTVVLTAKISGAKDKLEYNWEIEDGKIISGNNTHKVTVSTNNDDVEEIFIYLDVIGSDYKCWSTATVLIPVKY